MKWAEFKKWFNRDFWKAFKDRTFPIKIPSSRAKNEVTVRRVYESIISAHYAPSIPETEIVLNKGLGIARTTPVFCIEDYIVYYFCIKELEGILCGNRTENTFGGWSLGGTMRKLENVDIEFDTGFSGARYSFNPLAWSHVFREFNALLYSQIDTGHYSHVLQFDLSNFYDCIRLDILERCIREDSSSEKGWIIALLFYFLNHWNRRNTGLHPQAVGIPQDALSDCSRILANYYLQKYDKFAAEICSKVDAIYFRYADDQMILLRSSDHVEDLMLLLTRNLDRYGLRVNQKKIELWKVKDLERHRCRKIQSIFTKKEDSQNPKLVREFADAFLAINENDLKNTWNKGLPLLNRLIWANIESLPKTIFEKLMIRYTSIEYLLRSDCKKLIRVKDLNRKRRKPVKFSTHLKKLGAMSCHNGFHYEALSFARSQKFHGLAKFLKKRIAIIEEQMINNKI